MSAIENWATSEGRKHRPESGGYSLPNRVDFAAGIEHLASRLLDDDVIEATARAISPNPIHAPRYVSTVRATLTAALAKIAEGEN